MKQREGKIDYFVSSLRPGENLKGILSGNSTGDNIYAAVHLAREIDREANIVTIVCDSGYKYFSTLYNDEWLKSNEMI